MSIDGIGGPPLRPTEGVSEQAPVGRAGAARRKDAASGPERPREPDTLEISEHARDLLRAQQAVDAAPDVRAERVAEIQRRVEDGTYTVAPDLLARKLLGVPEHEQ